MADRKERVRRIALWTTRVAVGLAIAVGLAFTVRFVVTEASGSRSVFRLREVHFEGLQHLDSGRLDQLIRAASPGNLLLIDLDRVRSLIESEDWVERAVVRRRLPDQLYVFVTERQPAAVATIDGQLQVVDPSGVVLAPYGAAFQSLDRPIVKGLKNVALENALAENSVRMTTYLRILADMDAAGPGYTGSISEIDVSDPERVAVVPTEEPVPVVLGAQDFARRYQSFLARLDLYRELKARHGVIESVDVTYEDKIIIHTPEAAATGARKGRESS